MSVTYTISENDSLDLLFPVQETPFTLPFTWKDSNGDPIDLTGYTAAMQVRPRYDADPIIDLDNSSFTIDGPNGEVTLSVSAADLTVAAQSGVYDVKVTNGTIVRRVGGKFAINPRSTE